MVKIVKNEELPEGGGYSILYTALKQGVSCLDPYSKRSPGADQFR